MNSRFKDDNVYKIFRGYTKYDLVRNEFSRRRNRIESEFQGGVPLAYNAEEGTLYVDAQDTHTIVYGATGSLKTRSVVMPTIEILAEAGESMIINDSKGELYEHLSNELRKKKYKIITINLREPSTGNAWNPLYIPYKFYMTGDIDKAAEFANDIANNLMEVDRNSKDPFWDGSSADLLFGLILSLFKYCKDHGLGEEAVNISNVLTLKRKLLDETLLPQKNTLWKYLSEDELIEASMSGTINTATDTKKGILSVFDQHMRTFVIQPTMMEMLANNDFDIAAIEREKVAVFIITPDEKTSYHRLVSLFVKQSYEYLIYISSKNEYKCLKHRVNYILDEFSSLPLIVDMPTMISAARSRNIRFLLVVQSKSSLKKKYQEEAETIVGNCSNVIFFTSRELDLLKELSELCGKQKSGEPNVSIYELQHLSKDSREALVLCGRSEPAVVKMIDISRLVRGESRSAEYKKGERKERKRIDFALSEEIKKRYESSLNNNDIPTFPTFEEFMEKRNRMRKNVDTAVDDVTENLGTSKNDKRNDRGDKNGH